MNDYANRKTPWITVEGVDGAGKSSQIPVIEESLRKKGYEVLSTREPGGTPLGEKLRSQLLVGKEAMNPDVQLLIAFASRAQHLSDVIIPAVSEGRAVVCDRFTDSSFAYQVHGEGASKNLADLLEREIQKDWQPDLTLVFDLPVESSYERMMKDGKSLDNFESKDFSYFERARKGYHERQKQKPSRIYLIDALQSKNEVSEQVRHTVEDSLNRREMRTTKPVDRNKMKR